MRATQREISRLLAVARETTPGLVPTLACNAIGTDRGLKFIGAVTIGGTTYEPAANNGRVKTFGDVDSFVKFVAVACENPTGNYAVSVNTGSIIASRVPADIIKDAQAKVVKLGSTKTAQQAVVADIDADLALMVGWNSGNLAQQAKFAEVTAQKAAVVADIAAIDAEVVRLNALIAG